MFFDEEDIDFLKLSDRQFEELCFDLLICLDFQGLIWRQGGADNGRDIEGKKSMNNPLVETYSENWFFECKRYKEGVPPEALNSKIAWADAERPSHLVVLTSSYLSNGARSWLEKLSPQKSYKIHVVEGKLLQKLVAQFPNLVARYFLDGEVKLFLEARRSWLVHNIIPEVETLNILVKDLFTEKLSTEELAFLWCSAKVRYQDVERWNEDNDPIYMDSFFRPLAMQANTTDPIISEDNDILVEQLSAGLDSWEMVYNKRLSASIVLSSTNKPKHALYAFVRDSEGEGLEVLVEATGDFPAKVRHLENDARDAFLKADELLVKFAQKA